MGTKNSDLVSNFEATPQVKNSAGLLHGSIRVAQGTIELASGDSDDDEVAFGGGAAAVSDSVKSGHVNSGGTRSRGNLRGFAEQPPQY